MLDSTSNVISHNFGTNTAVASFVSEAGRTLEDYKLEMSSLVFLTYRHSMEALEARRKLGELILALRDFDLIPRNQYAVWLRENLNIGEATAAQAVTLHRMWQWVMICIHADKLEF